MRQIGGSKSGSLRFWSQIQVPWENPKTTKPSGSTHQFNPSFGLAGKKKNTTKLSLDLPPSLATWLPSALLRLEDLNALHYAVLLFLAERTALGR